MNLQGRVVMLVKVWLDRLEAFTRCMPKGLNRGVLTQCANNGFTLIDGDAADVHRGVFGLARVKQRLREQYIGESLSSDGPT